MNPNLRKPLALTYIALILVSVVLPLTMVFVPVVVKATITDRPRVCYQNRCADPLEDIPAGAGISIDMSGVSVTGARVWVWFSRAGGASIDSTDAVFAGPIDVSQIYDTLNEYTFDVSTFPPFSEAMPKVSVTVGKGWINFTSLPGLFIPGVEYWVKVTDLAPDRPYYLIPSSDVAVSTNRIKFVSDYKVVEAYPDGNAIPNEPMKVYVFAAIEGQEYGVNLTYDGVTDRFVGKAKAIKRSYTYQPTGTTWEWTEAIIPFTTPDLYRAYSEIDGTITVEVVDASDLSQQLYVEDLTQPARRVYFGSAAPSPPSGDAPRTETLVANATATPYILYIGDKFNLSINYFPYEGSVTVRFENKTRGYVETVATATLNKTGGYKFINLTVPEVPWKDVYDITVVDNNNARYLFSISVYVKPMLKVEPSEGYVGDRVKVIGRYFDDYVGVTVNITFFDSYGGYASILIEDYQIQYRHWETYVTIPNATSCGPAEIDLTEDTTTRAIPELMKATFTVKPKLTVKPSSVAFDSGEKIYFIGTGYCPDYVYQVLFDNQYSTEVAASYEPVSLGVIYVEFIAAGIAPGMHVVTIYDTTSGWNRAISGYATFNVTGMGIADVAKAVVGLRDYVERELSGIRTMLIDIRSGVAVIGDVKTTLSNLDPIIRRINENVAVISTNMGTVVTDVGTIKELIQSAGGFITDIKNDVATIKTSVGDIKANLSALNPVVTAIRGDVAIIKTDVGEMKANVGLLPLIRTTVDSINAGFITLNAGFGRIESTVGSINKTVTGISSKVDAVNTKVADVFGAVSATRSDIGEVKTTVSDVKSTVEAVPGLVTAVWIAVAFSVISAAAAIFVAITIMRKIAG